MSKRSFTETMKFFNSVRALIDELGSALENPLLGCVQSVDGEEYERSIGRSMGIIHLLRGIVNDYQQAGTAVIRTAETERRIARANNVDDREPLRD